MRTCILLLLLIIGASASSMGSPKFLQKLKKLFHLEEKLESTNPTAGWQKIDWTYNVNHPWNIPVEQRFTKSGDEFYMKVYSWDKPHDKDSNTDPRTELSI